MDLLPPDLLREISGRLHAADFIRFHGVCRAWRDSHSRDVPTMFLPCLLASNKEDNESIEIRCVFSKTSYRAPPPAERRSWVASVDGTVVGYFTAGRCSSGLHYPITGNHTIPLPPFPRRSDRWEQTENPDGIIYGDGTILLFSDWYDYKFKAAVLHPGDTAWTLIERNLPYEYGESCCVVYHRGKIMVTVEASEWLVMAINGAVEDDVLVPMPWLPRDDDDEECLYHRSYALETRGELLWVTVQIWDVCNSPDDALRVFVLALQEAAEGPEKLSWVRKDGRSLADRVLFLGYPNSFAVEASRQLGGDGGCAYFLYEPGPGQVGVFRYNLIDDKAEIVEWLPYGCYEYEYDEWCTWLVPQPAVAPIIQGISEKSVAPKLKQQTTTGPRRAIQMLRGLFQCVGAQRSSRDKRSLNCNISSASKATHAMVR